MSRSRLPIDPKAMKMICELYEQPKPATSTEIAKILDKKGIRHPTLDRPLTDREVRRAYDHVLNDRTKEAAKRGETCDDKKGEHSQPCDNSRAPSDAPPAEKPQTIPETWIEPLRTLIRSEVQGMLPQVAIAANHASVELPPPVPRVKGSKKYEGERKTLPGSRIDAVLFDRFEEERDRLGIAGSELMQRILWSHYGKPLLSFEDGSQPSQESQDTPDPSPDPPD